MAKLGIAGGGAMGSALLKGIINHGLIPAADIYIAEIDSLKREKLTAEYHIQAVGNMAEVVHECDTIILAVKPQMMAGLLKGLAGGIEHKPLLISIAAGVSLASLESQLPNGRFVRVMPNTPARIGKGVAVISSGHNITKEDLQWVEKIFGCIGKVLVLPENYLDAVTAVSGSGPAYIYYFIEAMVDAGVMLGLSRADALVLVTETVLGSAELLKETGEDPRRLRNEVTSPGGTTAAALFELEQGACAGTIMKAIAAAAQKSGELGRSNR